MRKYGFDNFKFEILELTSLSELNNKERFYIQLYNSKNNGYNSTFGGEDNPSLHEEIVKKRTEKILNSPEIRKKLSHKGSENGNSKLTENDVIQIR